MLELLLVKGLVLLSESDETEISLSVRDPAVTASLLANRVAGKTLAITLGSGETIKLTLESSTHGT